MMNEFYDELCRECDAIIRKEKHSLSDVEKFNTLCKAKKNLEQSEGYSGERYTNMNHGLNSPELSYGNSYHGGSYSDISRGMGHSERMYRDGNMSHHSIIDRMINATEGLMDQAGSDFERKVLKTWANKMRTEGYGD